MPADWATATRTEHRHWVVAEAARAGAAGVPGAAADAHAGLRAWLAADRPGHGIAWTHASDAAIRLVHWHAALSWLGDRADADLCAAMTGSADWHLAHLDYALKKGAAGHRRIAPLVGLVVGAATFPAAPRAEEVFDRALGELGERIAAQVHEDGVDRDGSPGHLSQTCWLALVTRHVGRAHGWDLSPAAVTAIDRAVNFLGHLAGEIGSLPDLGEVPPDETLWVPGQALAWSLVSIHAAQQEGSSPGPVGDDARAAWLGAAGGIDAVSPGDAAWTMFAHRAGGVVIALARTRGRPLRVVVDASAPGLLGHPAPLQVLVDAGDAQVLADPGPSVFDGDHPERRAGLAHGLPTIDGAAVGAATIEVARVDGKKATIRGRAPMGSGRWQRDVRLDQARIFVEDRVAGIGGAVEQRWLLGPGWTVEGGGGGFMATRDGISLAVKAPPQLAWSIEPAEVAAADGTRPAVALVGRGRIEPGAAWKISFEVR
jgi:hypothetical protein